MNVVVDYGLGNIESVRLALNDLDIDLVVSDDYETIKNAKTLILPGVGAFRDAMSKLKETGLDKLLVDRVNSGVPILGICLGMQLLFETSYEDGEHKGLGLLKGSIERIPENVKVPHMGWNSLNLDKQDDLVKYLNDGDFVYYVHSYYAVCDKDLIVASSDYGVNIPGIVRDKNIMGIQFHPEKSSVIGLNILRAYKETIIDEPISSN
jgi:glutamine amidotransferase